MNLLTLDAPRFYDIALRDFGLMLGALALGRLAWAFAPGRREARSTVAYEPTLERSRQGV